MAICEVPYLLQFFWVKSHAFSPVSWKVQKSIIIKYTIYVIICKQMLTVASAPWTWSKWHKVTLLSSQYSVSCSIWWLSKNLLVISICCIIQLTSASLARCVSNTGWTCFRLNVLGSESRFGTWWPWPLTHDLDLQGRPWYYQGAPTCQISLT